MFPGRDNGYTLIELLVVLGILSLIAAFAIPVAGRAVEGVMLQTDARALVIAMRRLETTAITQQQTITLSAADGKLKVSSGDAVELPDGGEAKLSGADDHIDFFPDGTTTGGGLTLSHGDSSLRIEVAWLSGEVKLVDDR
jgi:general secretion pathway protein H